MRTSFGNKSDKIAANRICSGCVSDRYLKALIEAEGKDAVCSYCEDEAKTISIENLADRVERAFEDHYERTPTEPEGLEAAMHNDSESNYCWERHGEEVVWAIANAADIKERIAKDVQAVLEDRHSDRESHEMGVECEFDSESYYAEKDAGCHEFSLKWNEFESGLKSEARFFSRSALAILQDIFADLQSLQTSKGQPVVAAAGPDTPIKFLYRARVFAGEEKQLSEALEYPWKHLGPPPMRAASAGRMNARGIAVFYGAIDSATTLAEVRPPVGSQVAVAKFIIERPLKLLDVAALKSVTTPGSIFDPKYVRQLQRANFLKILSDRISSPVMPHEEAIEYLPTQAVADYLAIEAKLDGIIFPSVQVGQESSNVVLFHHASRVAAIDLPKGTEVNASLEDHDSDGITPAYRVWEIVPPETKANTPPEPDPLDFLSLPEVHEPFDARPISLKIDLTSIEVHHIKSVSFSAEVYPVDRHRHTRPESSHF
jgi:hypothetical protein